MNRAFVAAMCACMMFATESCRRAPRPPATPSNAAEVRIISLSPAISRTLIDLKLQDKVVGRTKHCESLDRAIPAVGDLLNIDYEQVVRLKPTHILVQPPESGVDRHLIDMARDHDWRVNEWKLNDLDDIETLVRELPGAIFADGSAEFTECARASADVLNQMAATLTPGATPVFRGRTLIIYSISPISVFGAGTYLDDVLRSLGGVNAMSAQGWVSISAEDLVRLDPQAIIFAKPGIANKSMYVASGPLWELDVGAFKDRLVGVITNSDAFLPSSGVIGVAEEMRAILEKLQEDHQALYPE